MKKPTVLFVCVKNGGKSQMAAGLMRQIAGDVVVTLGRETHVDPVPGTQFEGWDTDEPSERGIDGIDRMRLVRDDIAAGLRVLADQLGTAPTAQPRETIHEQG